MGALAAGISGGASLLGGAFSGKGAEAAAKANAKAQQQQLALEQNEFNTISGMASPTVNAGNEATSSLAALLGLSTSQPNYAGYVQNNPDLLAAYQKNNNGESMAQWGQQHWAQNGQYENRGYTPFTGQTSGTDAQNSAIAALKASPLYTGEFNSGLDALNQSAAATGGLRGGNNALNESNFGSALLNSLYQQQVGNLSGVVNQGNSALGTLSSAGNSFVNASGQTNTALGVANGQVAASPYAMIGNAINSLGSAAGSYFGSANGANNASNYPSLQGWEF